jgi:hypothetical protein
MAGRADMNPLLEMIQRTHIHMMADLAPVWQKIEFEYM